MPITHRSASAFHDSAALSTWPLLVARELGNLERSEGTVLLSALRRAREELREPCGVPAGFDNRV